MFWDRIAVAFESIHDGVDVLVRERPVVPMPAVTVRGMLGLRGWFPLVGPDRLQSERLERCPEPAHAGEELNHGSRAPRARVLRLLHPHPLGRNALEDHIPVIRRLGS